MSGPFTSEFGELPASLPIFPLNGALLLNPTSNAIDMTVYSLLVGSDSRSLASSIL